MKLFAAVALDDRVRDAAAALVEECRIRAGRLAPKARITWVASDRLHVTVRFIGVVDDGRAAAIREALSPPLAMPPFECTITGTGAFPGRGQPRVIWAGVGDGRTQLAALEGEVSGRLARVGVAPDQRPYTPHVTLARVRDAAGLRADRLLDGLAALRLGILPVSAVTLFDSRLSANGLTYMPVMTTPLGGVTPADQ